MDASRTGKRLTGKTALIIKAVQGIGTASVLAIVKTHRASVMSGL